MGIVLMENRNGLAVDATLIHATGTAEREAAPTTVDRRKGRRRTQKGSHHAGRGQTTRPPFSNTWVSAR